MTTFQGVDHAGIGVGDMDQALEFWSRKLGFTELFFDYTGPVPGLEEVAKSKSVKARIVMLGNKHTTRLGPGKVKLVQRLDGAGAPPYPAGIGYGEVGLAEVCLHTLHTEQIFRQLVDKDGCKSLMEPLSAAVGEQQIDLDIAYIADPWMGKVELIDWKGLWTARPAAPRIEGVNHVAFGVHDMKVTTDFYKQLGFTDQIFESTEFFGPMAPWYQVGRELPGHHMTLWLSGQGAGIEPVRLTPLWEDCRGEWGHVGPMDFGIGVQNIKKAVSEFQKLGIEMHSEIQVLDVGNSEFKYVYFKDPDDQYVSIVETSY
jgi:catechol 2,3-dioxygenase-like lactoylglutathione lyase family enzyme